MKDLNRLDYSDSIIQNQELQIINFKQLSILNDNITLETNLRLISVSKDLKKSNFKLNLSIKLFKISVPISIGTGFILGYLIFKKA